MQDSSSIAGEGARDAKSPIDYAEINLGFEDVTFHKPAFYGDTIKVRTEVTVKRKSKKRPNAGIALSWHLGIDQRDEIVCECKRARLMLWSVAEAEGEKG